MQREGGNQPSDRALTLPGSEKYHRMIHRRDGFRAHAATVAHVRELVAAGKMELRTFWEVKAIHGSDVIERVTIVNNKTKQEEAIAIDCGLPPLGFISSPGAIAAGGVRNE